MMDKDGNNRQSDSSGLLAQPMQPGTFRICPECGAWFALQLLESRPDRIQGRIRTYRCCKCSVEVEFAECHPPDAI